MNKTEANKHFPLWKVELGERVYGRDSGAPWSDPENDIRKSGSIKYYSKADVDSEWKLEYSEGMGNFDYALHKTAITLAELQMRYGMEPKETTSMFEYNDKMFIFEHWCPDQKCVCGKAIDEYYNDYEEDNTVKADIIKSTVFFYDIDCLVMKNGKFYLNGKMVGTKEEIKEKHGIDYYQAEMMYPENIRKKFCELFPEATSYYSWSAAGYLNKLAEK
ncbi:hypothetical protein COK15_14945 [Bacillus cereus]|uniref:hypothetical protein n=1 Tax=Bacillus cereus TaxID=1396 RepID=UPI000BF335EA|nr:hypothetical protein [Bacillus cereus]PFQ75657.1 hypothetical protein COK15_14945 [Bacillus cereus]